MPVYRITIKGRRKPILTKADSAAKARDAVVECEQVTAEDMIDALGGGEKIWTPGDDLPADEPAPEVLQVIADERAVKSKPKDAGDPPSSETEAK